MGNDAHEPTYSGRELIRCDHFRCLDARDAVQVVVVLQAAAFVAGHLSRHLLAQKRFEAPAQLPVAIAPDRCIVIELQDSVVLLLCHVENTALHKTSRTRDGQMTQPSASW